jgi:membrane fusion protein (multidrug efflux system)
MIMNRRKQIIIGFMVLLVVGASLYRILSAGPSADVRRLNLPLVKLEPAGQETVMVVRQFTGDVVAVQQAGIFSKVSGNLERVYVDIGTPVRAGQVLALIDTTELRQQYQAAAATYENARITYQRSKDLFGQNLLSRQDIDNSETAYKIAAAAMETASTRLGYARIKAPFAGVITRRYLDRGAFVTLNNSTLFTLMDIDAVKVIINILEKDIPLMADGKQANITVDAYPARAFPGSVTRFSRAVDPNTRTMAVEIDIPNRDHALAPGMYANVVLVVTSHPDAVTIPTAAMLKDDRGYFVFTVTADTARAVRILPGVEQGAKTEVLSGLGANTPIVTTGQQFARDGGAVIVQK